MFHIWRLFNKLKILYTLPNTLGKRAKVYAEKSQFVICYTYLMDKYIMYLFISHPGDYKIIL